ncbi:MAG: Arc family DNA binding domain-containing protein [Ignavibacteriaceae bacterium]|nr:Arc family DNA binding domain-containing protein [Ignavibacteriaceae bacterium]
MAEKKSIILRIDPKLWEDLNSWAKDELRSLNAQIEYILRESSRKRKISGNYEPGKENDKEAADK